MSSLILDLKRDHEQLLAVLILVKELGIGTPQGRTMLFSAREALVRHLQKEAEELYPVMRKAAQTDPALKQVLDTFAKDMEAITKAVMDFFRKYPTLRTTGVDFTRDFGKVFSLLEGRIRSEEAILYREFERIKV